VIDDWSDNGRVDRVYPLDCYQQAIEAMPPDIRDYTDAHDSIERALTLAVRGTTGVRPAHNKPARALAAVHPIDTSGSPTIPLPLIALGALAGTALAAGALSYAFRRATLGRRSDAR
jgi:hypothetical protein